MDKRGRKNNLKSTTLNYVNYLNLQQWNNSVTFFFYFYCKMKNLKKKIKLHQMSKRENNYNNLCIFD